MGEDAAEKVPHERAAASSQVEPGRRGRARRLGSRFGGEFGEAIVVRPEDQVVTVEWLERAVYGDGS